MLLVVMLEGNRQIAQRRFSIRFRHVRHVITLDCLYEAPCHAIALRAALPCGYRLQAGLASKQTRLLRDIGYRLIKWIAVFQLVFQQKIKTGINLIN